MDTSAEKLVRLARALSESERQEREAAKREAAAKAAHEAAVKDLRESERVTADARGRVIDQASKLGPEAKGKDAAR